MNGILCAASRNTGRFLVHNGFSAWAQTFNSARCLETISGEVGLRFYSRFHACALMLALPSRHHLKSFSRCASSDRSKSDPERHIRRFDPVMLKNFSCVEDTKDGKVLVNVLVDPIKNSQESLVHLPIFPQRITQIAPEYIRMEVPYMRHNWRVNETVLQTIAMALGVSMDDVSIYAGIRTRQKLVVVASKLKAKHALKRLEEMMEMDKEEEENEEQLKK